MKTLYVTDLDGTLLTPDKTVSPRSAKILNRLIDEGVMFTLATGRSPASVGDVLGDLKVTLPAVLLNGTILYDLQKKEYVDSASIPPETAKAALAMFREFGRIPFLYLLEGDGICVRYEGIHNEPERRFCEERRGKAYKRFEQAPLEIQDNDTPIYFTMMDECDTIMALYERVTKIPGLKACYYLDNYEDIYFLEVFSDQASKSLGIERLRKRLGADRVVAFGDNGNDLDMLEEADEGYAVMNAMECAKACADGVIGSNLEDGVAEFILSHMKKM